MYNDELIESSKIKWQSFLKGDDDAYAWLYSRYVQQLYQYGCRFTTDTEMVKDCVQDVFVNVYRQKDRYSSPPDNVKIYLMSSLRNSIFNVFNKGNLHDTYISISIMNSICRLKKNWLRQKMKPLRSILLLIAKYTLSQTARDYLLSFFWRIRLQCHLWIDGA